MMMESEIKENYLAMFKTDYQAAQGYHRRAEMFSRAGRPANLVFNIASMALERYLVALCDLHGIAPENHDYGCLMGAVEAVFDFPTQLNQEIRALDEIFGLCSLEANAHGDPKTDDACKILILCQEVRNILAAVA